MIKLSKRLEAIVAMASSEAEGRGEKIPLRQDFCVADVGTDHGFVPICLVERGIASRAVAMDVGEGPLGRAREHVAARGLQEKIELRLSDGLAGLMPGEADLVVITGMGGGLMLRILEEGPQVRETVNHWVLSPQSELALFRHGLEKLGMEIRDEILVEEDGKYYTILSAGPGEMHYEEEFRYRYGNWLIKKKTPVFWEYLRKEEEKLLAIREKLMAQGGSAARYRLAEIERELGYVKGAYDAMQRTD